jgi:hypothetical protein
MTHEKKCHNYEKRKKHIETKLPRLRTHHKIGFEGSSRGVVPVGCFAGQYQRFGDSGSYPLLLGYLSYIPNCRLYYSGYLISPVYRYYHIVNSFIHLKITAMTKLYSLFGGTTTDTAVKIVEINQVIQMEGYSYDRYVVYKITHNQFGYHYHLINLRTLDFHQSEIIKPLSQKFGIGMYYDENNIGFMPEAEVAELYAKAKAKQDAEREAERKENERREEVRVIGREWLRNNLPADAKAIIVGRLKQDESDSQTDYFASSTVSNVILGFSKHTKDIFSEMRKHASNFEGTAHLAEYNEDYEHREKYSMGAGYYLGESKYHGWIIEKEPIYNRERIIEEFAYTAGCPDSIYTQPDKTNKDSSIADNSYTINKNESEQQSTIQIQSCNLHFEIVDYSEKAIALFGDTKAIKDLLSAMGGKFNPRLTYRDSKKAGWIFSRTKRTGLEEVLNLNNKQI